MNQASHQKDMFRDSPHAEAARWRLCAETERVNPYFPPSEREKRAAYYEQRAQDIERGVTA